MSQEDLIKYWMSILKSMTDEECIELWQNAVGPEYKTSDRKHPVYRFDEPYFYLRNKIKEFNSKGKNINV